jgi:hypothetical protein
MYREEIDDERLRAVSDHVRAWLFGDGPVKAAEGPAILPMNAATRMGFFLASGRHKPAGGCRTGWLTPRRSRCYGQQGQPERWHTNSRRSRNIEPSHEFHLRREAARSRNVHRRMIVAAHCDTMSCGVTPASRRPEPWNSSDRDLTALAFLS